MDVTDTLQTFGLPGMLEETDYQSSRKELLFVVTFIDWNTEYKKRASIPRVHTRYSKNIAFVMKDMRQCVRSEKDLFS